MHTPNRRKFIFAVAIATVIVVAGGLGSYWGLVHRGSSGQPVVDDGPTLYQAIAGVNQSLRNATGGPWALFSVYGVAAQAPYSANIVGYP